MVAVNPGLLHWWTFDLPREQERTFRRYLARNKQYKSADGSTKNPIPFPTLVSPDMARWYNPNRGWLTYNAQPQGLVTALQRGWLPEAPEGVAPEVEESGETLGDAQGESGKQHGTGNPCPHCDYNGKTKIGLRIHLGLKHK